MPYIYSSTEVVGVVAVWLLHVTQLATLRKFLP